MLRLSYIASCILFSVSAACHAQVSDGDKRRLRADSLKSDYEEWLLGEPKRASLRDSQALAPLPPQTPVVAPSELVAPHPQVSIPIMTPALRTDMQLAFQSHWLEEQRKAQQGGAMTIGVDLPSLIGFALRKIIPSRKSKKERQREKLKQILDNY